MTESKYYDKIANESSNVLCFDPIFGLPIDTNMYIVVYITDAGIPSCGLYILK